MSTEQAYQAFCHSVADIAVQYGRDPENINILAVSKSHSAEQIKVLYNQGQRSFGENYLQEALAKQNELQDFPVDWHFIGRVQSNKTRQIAKHFAWVHSIVDFKIAKRLNEQRPTDFPPLNILLQVNLQPLSNKIGLKKINEILELANNIGEFERLNLRGLMVMPELAAEVIEQRAVFKQVKNLFDELKDHGLALDTLSMGTSSDYISAIAEGSTMIRIGTALFGERSFPSA